jgi:hypothetical protein
MKTEEQLDAVLDLMAEQIKTVDGQTRELSKEKARLDWLETQGMIDDLFHDHFAADIEATALDKTRSSTARLESLHRSEIGQVIFVFRRSELPALIARLDAVGHSEKTTSHSSTLVKLLESYESCKT